MILKEMIDLLHFPQRMQIRNEEGWEICTCTTDSEGVLPYMNWYVTEWFGNYKDGKTDFVVFVKETQCPPMAVSTLHAMRLIDVGKFEEKNAKVWRQYGKEDCYYSVDYILSQASVDAIPVEWIAEWVTTHDEFSWSRMLHDWRKEE